MHAERDGVIVMTYHSLLPFFAAAVPGRDMDDNSFDHMIYPRDLISGVASK